MDLTVLAPVLLGSLVLTFFDTLVTMGAGQWDPTPQMVFADAGHSSFCGAVRTHMLALRDLPRHTRLGDRRVVMC